jgi:hypothetical protein
MSYYKNQLERLSWSYFPLHVKFFSNGYNTNSMALNKDSIKAIIAFLDKYLEQLLKEEE